MTNICPASVACVVTSDSPTLEIQTLYEVTSERTVMAYSVCGFRYTGDGNTKDVGIVPSSETAT